MPVRPKQPPVALRHPELETMVVPVPSQFYADDDPLVLAHPWAFGTEAELAEGGPSAQIPVSSVPIETGTKAPGEKRVTRRTRSSKK